MTQAPALRRALQRVLPWAITLACFAYLYTRLGAAARREDTDLFEYLTRVFADVSWPAWLALMVPYSLVYFLIDSAVVWRVVSWFNTRIAYAAVLPIRGSSFILSILNEQVSKGAMALYLNRRHGVPGWEVGSSMLFIMFCEFYYLLAWAALGYALRRESLPAAFGAIPWTALAAGLFFAAFWWFFRSGHDRASGLRDRPLFRAFRRAAPGRYLTVMLMRSPALILAAWVYSRAAGLFGVSVGFGEMLGYLPVVFFGASTPGPMRSVAITFWVLLFPGHEVQMAAFGLVQHNFFIFFNAVIGLLFLRRAQRELFAEPAVGSADPERQDPDSSDRPPREEAES